jgi:antirestriction protein ArdC
MSKTTATNSLKADVYTRVTARIIEDLEAGTRPWMKPWSAANTEGRITRGRCATTARPTGG